MVHAYSLAHDDLPCMDDDDLRRGRPTVHKVWDEAMGVLVGDALQTLAFETLARGDAPAERRVLALAVLARAAGPEGMVGGQVLDLGGEGKEPELDLVRAIDGKKTAAMIRASSEVGAILGGADDSQRAALRRYGERLGIAFQIVDDCLDETATAEELGKPTHKDRDCGKLTWPACVGVEASMAEARRLTAEATAAVASVKGVEKEARFLEDLAAFVVNRRI
jgi:farnesyl diphosphate synthase